MNERPYLSIVVPLYNEEGNVKELHRKIKNACEALTPTLSQRERGILGYEIIFIDDGSKDKTAENCFELTPLKLIKFRRNFGQTAAFDAGIKAAKGDIIVTIDGDLQNDPADIKLLLEEMNRGFDVVSGWRWQRKDSFMKRFFSRGANLLRKILIHDHIHDSGCSLKAYKKECFDDVDLFGEMHRFIPAILELEGYKASEIKVSHHPRIHGVTKYNWKRAMKGFVDMISIWFWRKYANRPLHLFGGTGIVFSIIGSLILIWMMIGKIFFAMPLSQKIWPLMGVFFIMIGIQLFISGLLADILIKNYYKNQKRMNYSIKEVINL